MKTLYFLLLSVICFQTHAQYSLGAQACADGRRKMDLQGNRNARPAYPGDPKFDVSYYGLDLKITSNPNFISGNVAITFSALENISEVNLDLKNNFLIDSITGSKRKLVFTHVAGKINVKLSGLLAVGKSESIKIFYRGVPPVDQNGGFFFETHGSKRESVISSLSEPYGAPDWWPCKDDPADKAESADIILTMPAFYTPVSNGKLLSKTVNVDGTQTFFWRHQYPISHYLISIAASNYSEINNWFKYSETDSMPVNNYLYPEILGNANAINAIKNTPDMLRIFSEKYGLYPFINEKYGHAMFNFGGGMEHQTVSSMGGFTNGLVAHELAHQWYGDKVTCKTWQDIWVNEGFATYSEAIYYENAVSRDAYNQVMAQYMDQAKSAKGSIYVQNIDSIDEIFDFFRTYAKGATVLHMLRGITGDETFFSIMEEYANGEYAYSAAGIDDFQKVAEKVSGTSLDYFFKEWLYGNGYPEYSFGWSPVQKDKDFGAALTIKTGSSSSTQFKMPVQLLVNTSDGKSEIRTVFVNQPEMQVEISGFGATVQSVTFDPDNLILGELQLIPGIITAIENSDNSFKIFPNPVQNELKLNFTSEEEVNISIFNSTGQLFMQQIVSGNRIDVSRLKPGKYFLQADVNQKIVAVPFIKF